MASKSDAASALLTHLTTELGSYPHWQAPHIQAFLQQGFSEEEITAEYRERLEMYDQYLRRKAMESTTLLRSQFGRVETITEQRVREWIRAGHDDHSVVRMYKAHVSKQNQ